MHPRNRHVNNGPSIKVPLCNRLDNTVDTTVSELDKQVKFMQAFGGQYIPMGHNVSIKLTNHREHNCCSLPIGDNEDEVWLMNYGTSPVSTVIYNWNQLFLWLEHSFKENYTPDLFKSPEKSTSYRSRLKSSSDDSDKENTGSKQRNVREVPITPSQINSEKNFTLEGLRSVLHTSAVPEHLPCRDEEYGKIKKFVMSAVGPKATSQAMYISGVPGTGKTASTKAVIQALEKKNKFTYIYINAMEFLEPKQIFVHIYKNLTGEDRVISAQNARKKLNLKFQTYDVTRRPVLMLVDELDQLSSRRQEIIYDIFNWTTLEQARVSVIAIANTLDLPERMLSQKISSRLGTNRIIFQPYEFQQIEEIIESRIQDFSDIVSSDAVQLAARRVAAISGDLRKAIDTLRRSVEIAISKGSATLALQHVLDAHKEATSVAVVLIVCNLSRHEELVFSAAVNQVRSKGVEEFNFAGLYREYRLLCTSREGIEPWHDIGIHSLVMKMATSRLLIASPGKNMMLRKLRLGMLLQEAEIALKERKNQEREREA